MKTGYRVCLALIARHKANGNPQLGWKVGLTARAIREQIGADSPTFAVLYSTGRWPSGVSFPASSLTRPGWEVELCLKMGETLKGPDVTLAQAQAAIATVSPALEIIEHRPPPGQGTRPLSAADNGQQRAFVVGEETRFDPKIHDLAKVGVDLYVDGEFKERAYGNEILESSPAASVVWLTRQLAEFDLALEAGSVIMSGSFTKQYRFDKAVGIDARFDTFGSVTAKFT